MLAGRRSIFAAISSSGLRGSNDFAWAYFAIPQAQQHIKHFVTEAVYGNGRGRASVRTLCEAGLWPESEMPDASKKLVTINIDNIFQTGQNSSRPNQGVQFLPSR